MELEILLGIFTLIPSFIAVMGVVVKVNRTLTRLDDSVKQLTNFMEKQSLKNHSFGETLSNHEMRLTHLEDDRKEK